MARLLSDIPDDEVVWVGLSDGQDPFASHYVAIYDNTQQDTLDWCKAVNEKYGGSQVAIKMTGKMLKAYFRF